MFNFFSSKSKKKKSTKSPKKKSSKKTQIFQLKSIPKKKIYNEDKIINLEEKMDDNKKISKKEQTELISYWIHTVVYPYIIPDYTFTQWFEQNYSSKKNNRCIIEGVKASNRLSNYIDIREKIRDIDDKIENYSGSGTPPKYVLEFINLLLREIGLKQIFCPDI